MKKEEKTERTKKRILAAAIQEFGIHGYEGAKLNAICESGIPKGLLYHNFKNKDALYLACVEDCFKKFTGYLRDADIGNDLEKYMRTRMAFFRENKPEARIFFDAVLQPPEKLYGQICVLKAEFDALNKELYSRILDTISLRREITYEEAEDYFIMMQEMFNHFFSGQSCRELSFADKIEIHERNLPKILDFMLYGIARREKE